MMTTIRGGSLLLLVLLLPYDASSFAPVVWKTASISSSSLTAVPAPPERAGSGDGERDSWITECKTTLAGLAVGCMLVLSPTASLAASDFSGSNSMNLAAGFGSSYETLDFSMPSYGDSKSTAAPKKDAPTFNPFGDFEPTIKNDDSTAAEKAAEAAEKAAAKEQAKAEAEAKRAAERAEREARRAEQQAAAEAARAEKEAQKEAQKAAAASAESVELPDVKLPDVKLPDVKLPDVKLPEITVPDVKLPEFNAPDVKLPEFSVPDVKLPEINVPDFKVPEFNAPKLPSSFKMPEISVPSLPESTSSSSSVPQVTMPDMPKIALPAISNPFGGGSGSGGAPVDVSTPQTVRDEAAKAARLNYLDADQLAKEAEAKARQVREAANAEKKAAAIAKDQACATRPGGKWICLRNPFNVGY